MTSSTADALRLLSVLMHYPDHTLLCHLDEIAAEAARLPDIEAKTAVGHFLAYLGAHAPVRLQENFTAAFDISPETTLNLTYHAYGDNEKRAAAMAQLQRIYDQAGWERCTGELPDYLPLLLEFLSIQPQPESFAPVWECLKAADTLIVGLDQIAPAYAALLRVLARIAGGVESPEDNGRVLQRPEP